MAKHKTKKISNHKRQAWGVLLLGIALLLFLAIISYSVNDSDTLNVDSNQISVKNWLGPVGAVISSKLMQWTLGYPILVLPLIMMLVGLSAINIKSVENPLRTSIILVCWSIILSIFLAFPEAMRTDGNLTEYYPSGLIGGWLAARFVIYLGKIGGLLFLILTSMVLFVVTIQIELAQIFRAFYQKMQKLMDSIKKYWLQYRQKREEAIAEKQRKKIELKRKKAQEEKITASQDEMVQDKKWKFPGFKKEKEEEPTEIRVDKDVPRSGDKPIQPEKKISVLEEQSYHDAVERIARPEKSDVLQKQGIQKELDFEVEDEHTDVEIDYDRLVKESIARYKFPSIDLLGDPPPNMQGVTREELKANAEFLEVKLLDFGVKAKVVRVTAGPVITLYELQPAPGVKVSSIVTLANDLALALEARGIRIIAPIPGKAAVGIEIPNRYPQTVYLKSLLRSEQFSQSNYELPLALGKTINGESYIADLTKMPHLLVAGSTGSGKSVGINTMIMSMLYAVNPGKVKFIMIDPKKLELSLYRILKDHYLLYRPDLDEEVITRPNNAVSILNSIVLEMERRYDQLAGMNARNIIDYNEKIRNNDPKALKNKAQQLPYLVILVDELADLMMVAAKEVETPVARLAQMARAVGIHLVLATQRPSVDVITGMIKANFPARIAYQVATKVDSRTVIDLNGAEQLLGNGDMLFLPPGSAKPIRLQNPFISTEEIEAVLEHIRRQPTLPYYSLPQPVSGRSGIGISGAGGGRDELYEEARAIVVQHQKGSVSLLQRRLNIGYSRAARLMDELEEDGIVGPPDGSKARDVLLTQEELNQM
jgi:S-DNA-T family DNA segregation ATPase FtsK/SpoIIIE